MDESTFTHLKERIDNLIRHVKSNTSDDNTSLLSQLLNLQTQVDKIFNDNIQFTKLDALIKDHNINRESFDSHEYAFGSNVNARGKRFPKNLNAKEKKELLLTKYGSIMRTYEQLKELKSAYKSGDLNIYDSGVKPIVDFKNSGNNIFKAEAMVNRTSQQFEAVLIKNMLMFEKYLHLASREHEFNLQMEDKLISIDKMVTEFEHSKRKFNKY